MFFGGLGPYNHHRHHLGATQLNDLVAPNSARDFNGQTSAAFSTTLTLARQRPTKRRRTLFQSLPDLPDEDLSC